MDTLDTSDPGNLGLVIDADTVLFCTFDHGRAQVADASGHVDDLRSVAGYINQLDEGFASTTCRECATNDPGILRGLDLADVDAQVLTRDVSVQWIGRIDAAANVFHGVLAGRGLGGSAGERTSWEVYVDTDSSNPQIIMGMRWETIAGVVEDALITLPASAPTDWTLWTVTRRWESATSVVVTVYAGEDLLGSATSTAGTIGGSTTATTNALDGDGLSGAIDQLRVVAREISHEEVRQTWRRLTVHQPAGVASLVGSSPPGAPWYRSATSGPARLAKVAGQALGYATAKGHELRETWLPSTAYSDVLAGWEQLIGARVAPADSLEVRRARVLDRFQREAGYSVPAVQELLADAFDQDAVDVTVLEFSADVADDFDGIDTRRWLARERNATAWSVITKTARAQAAITDDIRIEPGAINGPTLELAVAEAIDSYDACKVTLTSFPADAEAGILLRHGARGDRLFFGVRYDGVVYEVVYQRWDGGALQDMAPVVLATTSNTAHWFRVRIDPSPFALTVSGQIDLQLEWSTDGTTWSTESGLAFADDWNWSGCYVRGTGSSLAGTLDVRFNAHQHREARGPRAFHWYAYRDPGDPGTPNMEAAQSLVQGVKPAHTHAAAISSLDVLCDDVGSGCDRGPLGAL